MTKAPSGDALSLHMSKKSAFCFATSRTQADYIIEHLEVAQFSRDDISALSSDRGTSRDFAHEKSTNAPEGAVAGESTGGFLGGALGWSASIGVLVIPGVRPFLAAGPIMAALSGAAIGAALGGITEGLVGMGIPEIEAKRYEGKISEGNILISMHTETAGQIEQAQAIHAEAGAQDICVGSESAPPAERKVEGDGFSSPQDISSLPPQ